MARGHPLDHLGRTLPRSDWPSTRSVPGPLELVRRFVNTANLESGADRLARAEDLDAWLVDQGLSAIDADDDERARLTVTREVIRAAAVTHRDARPDDEPLAELGEALAELDFRFDAGASPFPMRPADDGSDVDRLLGRLTIAVAAGIVDGTWVRLKACTNCRWAFYDGSNNRSSIWCSMSACGGRAKVRGHRARRAAATG